MVKRPTTSELAATLKAIEEEYAAKLPQRLRDIDASLQRCRRNPEDLLQWTELQRQLHTLSGSAGTFGFTELGRCATELEIRLNALLARGSCGSLELRGERDLDPFARGLQDMLHWAATSPKGRSAAPPPAAAPTSAPEPRLLYLVNDQAQAAQDIAVQFQSFGYQVVILDCPQRLEAAIAHRVPAAVVMDLAFPTGILDGAGEITRIRANCAHHFSVIFISTRSNFEARLATVRAGADGYFSKPVDVVALIDRLDAVLREDARPCRILIVDDDVPTADYYATVLRSSGMDVKVLNRVADVLQALGEYRPELVLMDVYMPGCDGVTLAKLIRQDNMYLDVPIVFLSSEADLGKQLSAMASGADDFLNKPIQPAHLVSALSSRVERYRKLRALIMRDSLTGLFNHSAIKEHLMREIARAARDARPLALAMVDIDFFKSVNDSYGHPVGDQVIRALSRLLQQRLRRGDIVGRYGGEEFAVIMPGTDAAGAGAVLDQIRDAFSKIRHYAEEQDFTATFSAGVAELGDGIDVDALFRLADAALYQAKHGGRNRICR